MNMNYPIELRKTIYASVVPVKCGNERGSGFFISPDVLISARHVVADYVLYNQPVIIKTDKDVLCDVISLGEDGECIDVVLLKCKDYQQDDYLKLLSDVFNENRLLTIVGYPKEFGGCSELISMSVQDRLGTQKKDYDTMVVRTDSLAFTSYKGFSGSPVLNEKGSAIGIAIKEYHSSLGYVSIKSIVNRLEKNGVEVSYDWQSEDFSPLGRGTSQRQVQKAISYAALRYNRELHVSNDRLDHEINLFAKNEIKDDILTQLKRIETLARDCTLEFRDCLNNYQQGKFEDLYDRLLEWKDNHDEKDMTSTTLDFYHDVFPKLYPLIERNKLANTSVFLLKGNAGMGKTHYLCATAERLCKEMNVYLLFGSQFVENLEFESQLYEMMNLKGNDLQKLNAEMIRENTNALIMIDALNEGATESFWDIAMQRMRYCLKNCKHIKLLITFRNDENFHLKIPFQNIEIEGFADKTDEAINKYFKYYHIEDENGILQQKFQKEFQEPLFLSMFCVVAQRDMEYTLEDFTYSGLFHQYIKYRNEGVSKGVDEDPHRNITERALMKFANYSLYYNACNDISRKKARHYADQICRNRTWSKSLLFWLLKENLVLSTGLAGESLMFGYQKMGDFLMADVFAHNKMSDEEKLDFILEKGCNRKFYGYRRFIIALLSEWELTPALLQKKKSLNGEMVQLVLYSLKHYGKNNQVVFDWIKNNNIYNLRLLHDFFPNLSFDVFYSAHQVLKGLDMNMRDRVWSLMVNDEYSSRYDEERLNRFVNLDFDRSSEDDWKKVILMICWMCTSPHPFVRGKVLRKLVSLFDENPSMSLFTLDEFHDCNDPYVIQVCTCAIYGHLLRKHDAKEGAEVAEKILLYFYQESKAPDDILIRQWSMLILAIADELNPNAGYFGKINPPFSSPNPFGLMIDDKDKIKDDYFGTSKGAWRMYETLYGFSDFRRYIIGTNSHDGSYVFMQETKGNINALPLVDIMQLVANIAKHDFNWNDELGKLDDNVYSTDRYNNLTERFGKKYLWLALYKADALLSDNYQVVDNSRYVFSPTKEDIVPIPYPWHTREYSRIDPSVHGESEALPYTQFQSSVMEDVTTTTNEQWLAEDYPVQKPRLIVTDEDSSEWIVLTCYDGHKTNAESDTVKDLFLFSNAGFIKKDELEIFEKWAKNQNFYGRWMPECRNGSIDYLWNEYPWAPTYKRTIGDIEVFVREYNNKKFHLHLSYEAQLQENWIGLDENNVNLREASMPNHQMMESLDLYTAERGVIRDKTNHSVVARNFAIGKMNGLAIRKVYLDKYLSENEMTLVFYSLGEKYVRGKDNYQTLGKRHDLSGAYYYENGRINEIQAMHISNTL